MGQCLTNLQQRDLSLVTKSQNEQGIVLICRKWLRWTRNSFQESIQ